MAFAIGRNPEKMAEGVEGHWLSARGGVVAREARRGQ